jgi:hypothetical protein
VTRGFVSERFRGAKRDCAPCALRTQCLRTPEKTVHTTGRVFPRARGVGSRNANSTNEGQDRLALGSRSDRARIALNTRSASRPWSLSLRPCGTKRSWIDSRCAGEPRSMVNGSCSARSTTSKSSPIAGTRRSETLKSGPADTNCAIPRYPIDKCTASDGARDNPHLWNAPAQRNQAYSTASTPQFTC